MVANAEEGGPMWARAGDCRVTQVGSLLRKYRIDELPQIINLFLGHLSVVGPRPIRRFFADLLEARDPRYGLRFRVKPGLTGYAQIYAPYGSTIEDQLSKLPYDLKYDHGLSMRDYLMLIAETVRIVFIGKGI
jgi:lipopolysaccharide/colanic/teichoic acid biosynthesis glycosyltransferase